MKASPTNSLGNPAILLGMMLLLGLISGCILPTPQFDTGHARTNLNQPSVAQIQVGQSTIQDVILALGEPDAVSPDERKLAFRSEKVVAIWILGGGYSANAGALTQDRYLLVELDEGGLVRLCKLSSLWFIPTTPDRLMETKGWKAAGGSPSDSVKEVAEISGPAFWFPHTEDFFAFEPGKHARGYLTLTGAAIQFRDRTQTGNSPPRWRFPYEDLNECRLAKFGLTRRVVVRTRDGEIHSFEFEKNKLNAAACHFIQTRMPSPPFQ